MTRRLVVLLTLLFVAGISTASDTSVRQLPPAPDDDGYRWQALVAYHSPQNSPGATTVYRSEEYAAPTLHTSRDAARIEAETIAVRGFWLREDYFVAPAAIDATAVVTVIVN